ncbi:MAG: GC-type dockerin domain-anchored protein [Phycisphaerales bacterium]
MRCPARRALCAVILASVLAPAVTIHAAQIGSALINRPFFDSTTVVVAIYAGGRLPAGATVTTFSWYREFFTGGGATEYKVTPLLLEETTPGLFIVRAIGTTRAAAPSTSVRTAPFGVIAGSATTNGGNFTFGLLSASVSPTGAVSNSTNGAVEFTFPPAAGNGLGGVGSTNRWIWVPFGPITTVALGTSFGTAGNPTYPTNNSMIGGPFADRTYSAAVSTDAPPPTCPGDLTGDNQVNTADLTFFLGRFGQTATPGTPAATADFNNDGVVNTPDLTFFLGRFGNVCAS